MNGCCVLKKPFDHVGPFTCPYCHETSVPLTDEEFRAGLRSVRGIWDGATLHDEISSEPITEGEPMKFERCSMTPFEEDIGGHIVRAMEAGEPPYRRALVSPRSFWQIARRTNAKVESGPHGEYIVLIVATGPLYLVPNNRASLDECTFER